MAVRGILPREPAPNEDRIETHPVNRQAVEAILAGYSAERTEFRDLTRQAARSFRERDWSAMRAAADSRLHCYPRRVAEALVRLGQLSQWEPLRPDLVRRRFGAAVAAWPDAELARTFFNSVMRRLLGTVGADPETEFLDPGPPSLSDLHAAIETTWATPEELASRLADGLLRIAPPASWIGLDRDPGLAVTRLAQDPGCLAGGGRLALLPEPLLRGRRAFLAGRLETAAGRFPLILAAVHQQEGLALDAVITSPAEASMIFGFTRTYFQVDLAAPRPAVAFLRSLLPMKRLDELYTVLGYHKHGKREFYQELVRVLAEPGTRFEPAEGVPGMVMVVFALRPMNVVFKVIRDRALPPKQVSRREVREKYEFVFRQEYGGRLADTQEFEDLSLPADAFAPAVREELLHQAAETVRLVGSWLVFRHVYTERRMTPLDLHLRRAPAAEARAAVLDFGQAIKDLAGIGVFPGDMLAKNFGVTRHGRVVFYDYDEIQPLDRCTFRSLPEATSPEEEMAAEPWFSVRESDIFPEEFERFLRFPEPLHGHFLARHRDLFSAAYWQDVQTRVREGGVSEPPPYPAIRRLRPD